MFILKYSPRLLAPALVQASRNEQQREIKRWVAPVLREINKRKKKMGPEPIPRRSSFVEWNYNAELFAFNKRLGETIDLLKLQQAFVHRSYIIQEEENQKNLGVEDPSTGLSDNRSFVECGEVLINDYVEGFLTHSLPNMPASQISNIQSYLSSEDILAKIALNLGMADLVLSSDFPPQKSTLADTFKAVVGSLASSSGEEKAFTFIRDFVCTQLNQLDLTELCRIENPLGELKEVCQQKKTGEPEPRLIGESGKNTVLAAYHVGIYLDKKLIGNGFGEDIQTATDMAAYNALRDLWGFSEHMKPIDFTVHIEKIDKDRLIRTS